MRVITERLKERVYAQLSVVAVTIGLALGESGSARAAASAVAATALGLWLATVAADQQAHAAVHGRVARGHDLRILLFRTSPLLTAAIGPLLMIGLAALEVLPLVTALYLAAGVDLALMFVWGFGLGRRMGAGLLAALFSGLANLVIGLMVVGVKLLAGH
ncbi:hypothetical protein [Actinomycetospora straminea]|uniref:VIT family protein n=1 Tax=Actinomycetospora straminea TaxID=663607 RepID=A0ABP9EV49_9PSEU|nr:hypothetical protein [Actinomycetospora straminea]MDD7931457.1 hypothetical protein [Actinomycetospora straminea]